MNGLLLVDKPCGITSFEVVRRVRRWCATRQVGHCGTLDPAASGVLPVAVGTAARLVEYLLAGDKEYLATLCLGVTTDTQDGEGRVVATHPWDHVDRGTLEAAAATFRGTLRQVPPMYSALKRDGVPLYRLARQGLEVHRESREVLIETLEVLDHAPPLATLRVVCSKGTYVRTLCHDLGAHLGCGGHLAALRRTRCGPFSIDACTTLASLEQLAAAARPLPLIPMAEMLPDWPGVEVLGEARQRLVHGVAPDLTEVTVAAGLLTGQPVRLLADGRLAAVARFAPGGEGGRRGDFVLDKVFPVA